MRIIGSKFHDYYDTVMAHGTDKTLVYTRSQEIRPINGKWDDLFVDSRHRCPNFGGSEHTAELGVVLFCGKQVPFIRLIYNKDNRRINIKTVYAYGVHDVDEFVNETCTKRMLDLYYGTNKTGANRTHKRSGSYRERQKDRNKFKKFFDEMPYKVLDVNEFHHTEKVPVIIVEENREKAVLEERRVGNNKIIIINPCLADVAFYKVLDAFTAFQEISMFLGGVLGVGAPKMVAVSDAVRAHKHGMDKTSFRMPSPGDRKFRRRSGP